VLSNVTGLVVDSGKKVVVAAEVSNNPAGVLRNNTRNIGNSNNNNNRCQRNLFTSTPMSQRWV
jgi:16S rRNA C967 or C1407 C5-methylase (RsmB/RsmF family)